LCPASTNRPRSLLRDSANAAGWRRRSEPGHARRPTGFEPVSRCQTCGWTAAQAPKSSGRLIVSDTPTSGICAFRCSLFAVACCTLRPATPLACHSQRRAMPRPSQTTPLRQALGHRCPGPPSRRRLARPLGRKARRLGRLAGVSHLIRPPLTAHPRGRATRREGCATGNPSFAGAAKALPRNGHLGATRCRSGTKLLTSSRRSAARAAASPSRPTASVPATSALTTRRRVTFVPIAAAASPNDTNSGGMLCGSGTRLPASLRRSDARYAASLSRRELNVAGMRAPIAPRALAYALNAACASCDRTPCAGISPHDTRKIRGWEGI